MIEKNTNIETYLSDASNYQGIAEKVYIPESIDELKELIFELNIKKIAYTVQGSRTGLTGSAIPNSGVIISNEKLNHISFDEESGIVSCGPGTVHKDLDDFLESKGCFLPPNPTETLSSIGGNVATNASGSRTYKYGATREWVEEIEVILPNSEQLTLKRSEKKDYEISDHINEELIYSSTQELINLIPNIKHAAGYYVNKDKNLIDLIIGSEGTLGIISEIKLRTIPLPESLLGLIVFFNNSVRMLEFVEDLKAKRNNFLDPRLIEYFDHNSLKVLRSHFNQVPKDVVGAIWIENETKINGIDSLTEKWYEFISDYTNLVDETWFANNDKEHRFFREFRHKLPEEIYENLADRGMQKIGTDCAVPIEEFKEHFIWLNNELESLQIEYLVFGHIGNSHLHANIFYRNDKELEKAKEFYKRLIKKTISQGGTVSAEHGIGKIKKEYLHEMFGKKGIDEMQKIKAIFDPENLIGKGNLF